MILIPLQIRKIASDHPSDHPIFGNKTLPRRIIPSYFLNHDMPFNIPEPRLKFKYSWPFIHVQLLIYRSCMAPLLPTWFRFPSKEKFAAEQLRKKLQDTKPNRAGSSPPPFLLLESWHHFQHSWTSSRIPHPKLIAIHFMRSFLPFLHGSISQIIRFSGSQTSLLPLFWAITSSLPTFWATYTIQSHTFPCNLLSMFTWHHHSYFTPLLFKRCNYYQLPGCQNLICHPPLPHITMSYNITFHAHNPKSKKTYPLTVHGREASCQWLQGIIDHSHTILDSSCKHHPMSSWTYINPSLLIHPFPHYTILHQTS